MDSRGEVWKTLIVMVPILGATLIVVSRIMDARHHPFDVISGSILGIICACIAYRQYFPPITEAWKKGRAYPIRTWASDSSKSPVAAYDEDAIPLQNQGEDRFEPTRVSTRSPPHTTSTTRNPSTYRFQTNNPFEYNRSAPNDDRSWSSSSEDVADSYEMHHGYSQPQSSPGGMGGRFPGYYESDTSYQPRTLGANADAGGTFHTPSDVIDQRERSVTRAV